MHNRTNDKVQPTDFTDPGDYIRAKRSRKGCKSKRSPTVSMRDIYEQTGCGMEYKEWKQLIDLLHKAIRELMVKGHSIPIPYFGTLSYAERQAAVKHCKTADGKGYISDGRFTISRQALENQYHEAFGDYTGQTSKRNGKYLWINLKQKGHPRKFHFYAMKYMLRELYNNILGTDYIILR